MLIQVDQPVLILGLSGEILLAVGVPDRGCAVMTMPGRAP